MGQRPCPRPFLSAALAAGVFACVSPALAADADYCVTCKNPDQTYRCRVQGVGSRPSDALKLYCVIRTAKEGNHASCKAAAASDACGGLVKVYNYEGPALPSGLTADPRVRELKQRVEQDRRTFDKPDQGGAPKTLFELDGRAVDASAKGLRNARSALGGSSSDDPKPVAPRPAAAPPVAKTAPPAPPPSTASLPPPKPTAVAPVHAKSTAAGTQVKQAAQGNSSRPSFARRSYNCVLSFFRHCSGEAEPQ